MKESKLRNLIREEIQNVLSEERSKPVTNPKIFRKEVEGENVKTAAANPTGSGYQYELHFRSGKKLLIQDPDALYVNK